MSSMLGSAVSSPDDGESWDFQCPVTVGCGLDGVGFRSTGWPTAEIASARGQQHFDEHTAGAVAPELVDFLAANGLVIDQAGIVRVSDLA